MYSASCQLVFPLDSRPNFLTKVLLVPPACQCFFSSPEFGYPTLTNFVGNSIGQLRITLPQPSTGVIPLAFIGEFLRHHFVEIAENGFGNHEEWSAATPV